MEEDQTVWNSTNPNSLHNRLYEWRGRAYNAYTPRYRTDFCSYFWALFWAVLGIPFYPFYRLFKMIGYAIGSLLYFIDEHGGNRVGEALDKGVRWFWGKRFAKFVYPWSIATIIFFGWMLWALPLGTVLKLFFFVACGFLLCGLILGLAFGAMILQDRRRYQRMRTVSTQPSHVREVSTMDVIVSRFKRTKKKFCPIINLPKSHAHNSDLSGLSSR